jgi:hypothetical protein
MSDHQPLFETLKKLSITAIHASTNGTEDPLTLEGCLEYAKRIRMIIGPVQVMDFYRSGSGGHDLVLRLSPFYLHLHYLQFPGLDASFEWKFSLPKYTMHDYEDADGNHQCEEIGVVEWLTQSVVTVDDENLAKVHWVHEDFQSTFDEFA